MKYLFLSLFFALPASADWVYDNSSSERPYSCANPASGEVAIGWWNIRFGSLEREALQENLQMLAHSECAPDFLALGEYEADSLTQETRQALESAYPFHQYLPYSARVHWRGIQVYSKTPVSSWESRREMDWLSPQVLPSMRSYARRAADLFYSQEEVRYFDRRFNRFELQTARGSLILYPTHFAQPFAAVSERYGPVPAAHGLLFDTNNPLGHQIRSFLRMANPTEENALLFGDLNFPPAVAYEGVGVRTPYYQMVLNAQWRDGFRGNGPATFPTLSAPEASRTLYQLHPFQFDHVFHSSGAIVRELRSPRLKGSDHYPVFFIARVRDR